MNQVNHSSSRSLPLHHSVASSGGASVSTPAKIDDGGLYCGGFTSMLCQFYILIYGPRRCNWEGRCHHFERRMKATPWLIYASFINFYSLFYRSRRACIHCLHRWVQSFIFCIKAKNDGFNSDAQASAANGKQERQTRLCRTWHWMMNVTCGIDMVSTYTLWL